jgi:hypothetical protein
MKLTPEKLAAFCSALAETGNVSKACKAVDISRYTAYQWRQDNPEFVKGWDAALNAAVYAMEDEARRRAFEGTVEPVHYMGDRVDTIRKYSDTLAIFLLKAHAPEKYRERSQLDIGNANDKPFEVTDTTRAARLSGLVALANSRRASEDSDDEREAGEDLC